MILVAGPARVKGGIRTVTCIGSPFDHHGIKGIGISAFQDRGIDLDGPDAVRSIDPVGGGNDAETVGNRFRIRRIFSRNLFKFIMNIPGDTELRGIFEIRRRNQILNGQILSFFVNLSLKGRIIDFDVALLRQTGLETVKP